jgi:hypothetical protein
MNDHVENIVVVADILGGVGHNLIDDFREELNVASRV